VFIEREIHPALRGRLEEGRKVVLLYGARQVGKTTLARRLLNEMPYRFLELTGDDAVTAGALSSRDATRLDGLVAGYDLLFLDEAQRVPDVGLALKLLHDRHPDLRILVTGSSALDLASRTREALTGRTWSFQLHPFSFRECLSMRNLHEQDRRLERDLVYGFYPEVQSLEGDADREGYLRELHAAYLFKDLLEMGGLRHPRKLVDLVKLLAHQTGSLVSFSELGTALGMSKDTVASYVDLLEKAFIVFRLPGFSRNLRNEVTRNEKIYFFDLGVRNVAVSDFRPFQARQDQGALWENFLVAERRKRMLPGVEGRFWRLHTGAEVDYVELEGTGGIRGYEFKLSPEARAKEPARWREAYPLATWERIDRSNYKGFVDSLP
jgi:predicted AAA+ superfamily ATPase